MAGGAPGTGTAGSLASAGGAVADGPGEGGAGPLASVASTTADGPRSRVVGSLAVGWRGGQRPWDGARRVLGLSGWRCGRRPWGGDREVLGIGGWRSGQYLGSKCRGFLGFGGRRGGRRLGPCPRHGLVLHNCTPPLLLPLGKPSLSMYYGRLLFHGTDFPSKRTLGFR